MKTTGFTIKIDGVEKYLADFKSLSDAYKENLDTLKQMEVGTEEYYKQQKVVAQLKNGISEFNEALKEQQSVLKDVPVGSLESLNKEYKSQLKLLKKLEVGSDEYNEQLKVVAKLKDEIGDVNRALKAQQKEYENLKKGVSAYKELEAETRELKNQSKELAAQLVKLEKEGKKNTKEYKNLSKEYKSVTKTAKEYDETLKEIDETVGDSFRNVGNYKEAFSQAFEDAGIGVDGFGKKLKFLAANPIMLLITAVVAGLKLLFDAFKQSETGSEFFAKAAGIANGVMAVLVQIVEKIIEKVGGLGDVIRGAFENPKQALIDFKNLIVENIQNRIQGVLDTFGALGRVAKHIFKGEFSEASKAAGDAAKSFAQAATGASKETIDSMVETAEKTIDGYSKIELAKKNAAKVDNELVKQIENLATAYEIANQAAGDSTLSLKEQSDASLRAMNIKEQLAKLEIERARNNLNLVNTEMKLNAASKKSNDALYSAQSAALSELKAAEREYTLAVKENTTQRRELKRDAAERELDFLIDLFDKQKTINEQIINSDNITFQQRKALLEETVKLSDKAFKEQQEVIQNFTDAKINFDELIKISDAKVVEERVRNLGVDDVIAGRILEIIKERKQVLQDLADTESDISKRHRENLEETLGLEEEVAEQIAEIKYEKGLINQQEYDKLVLENELKRIEKELELNRIAGLEKEKFDLDYLQNKLQNEELTDVERLKIQEEYNQKKIDFDTKLAEKESNLTETQLLERQKIENEAELKRLEIREANIETELSMIDKKYDLEEDKLNEKFLKGEIKEEEYEDKLKTLREEKNEEKVDFIIEKGIEENEIVEEILDEQLQIRKNKNAEEVEEDEKKSAKKIDIARRMSASLRGISDGLFAALINAAEGNEEKQLELQRKQFQVNKAFAVTDVIINTSVAISEINKTFAANPILAGILTGLMAAQGAAQVAAIVSEPAPMAAGGFTGRGSYVDGTGERTAGVYQLHEGEYIAPRRQVEANRGLFQSLEMNRRTGAAIMNPNSTSSNDSALLSAISQMTSNISVVADSEEIVRLGLEKQQVKKSKVL